VVVASEELEALASLAEVDPEAADLLRRYRLATCINDLMHLLQNIVEGRVHPASHAELAESFRQVADMLAAPLSRH
jgi:hypothetical protein